MTEALNEREHAKHHQRQDGKRNSHFGKPEKPSSVDVTLDSRHNHVDRDNDSENLPTGEFHVVAYENADRDKREGEQIKKADPMPEEDTAETLGHGDRYHVPKCRPEPRDPTGGTFAAVESMQVRQSLEHVAGNICRS